MSPPPLTTRHLFASLICVCLCIQALFVVVVQSNSIDSSPSSSSNHDDRVHVVKRRQAVTTMQTPTTISETTANMTMNETTTTAEMLFTNEPYANNVVVIAVLCSFAGVGILATAGCLIFHGCKKPRHNEKALLVDSKASDNIIGAHVNEAAISVAGSSQSIQFKNPVTQIDTNRRFSKEESFEMNKIKNLASGNESKV